MRPRLLSLASLIHGRSTLLGVIGLALMTTGVSRAGDEPHSAGGPRLGNRQTNDCAVRLDQLSFSHPAFRDTVHYPSGVLVEVTDYEVHGTRLVGDKVIRVSYPKRPEAWPR